MVVVVVIDGNDGVDDFTAAVIMPLPQIAAVALIYIYNCFVVLL